MIIDISDRVLAAEFCYRLGINRNSVYYWKTYKNMLRIASYVFISIEDLPTYRNYDKYLEIFKQCTDLNGYYPMYEFEKETLMSTGAIHINNKRRKKNNQPPFMEVMEVRISDRKTKKFVKIPEELRKYKGYQTMYVSQYNKKDILDMEDVTIIPTSGGNRFALY